MPSLSTEVAGPTCRVLVPAGALGLGWDGDALAAGLARGPDLIAIDGGSTDSGPAYLGRGVSKYSRAQVKSDWGELVRAALAARVPLVIGTAGTCGAGSAVDWLVEITREVLAEAGQGAKIAVLYCDRDADRLAAEWDRVSPLPGAPDVAADALADCTNIVALAGAEQVQAALATGAGIVICGRTTDTAILAALPLARGCDAGGAWHGAKVGECGALCCTHPDTGVIEILFDGTGFTVTPMAEISVATERTVAAHLLYENSDPVILHEPGGALDTSAATYRAEGRAVRVEGAVWTPAPYTVKLEAARVAGHGVMSLALVRDPHYVAEIDDWCASLEARARARIARQMPGAAYDLELRRIGLDAALGALEPGATRPNEIGIMAQVIAPDAATAQEVAKLVNPLLLHHPLTPEEPMPTFAFPFSPPEVDLGTRYEFVLHHVLALDDPMDGFRLEVLDV
ncbi:acyclic terpene utilization AtuA family protein [uncultured Jannaschia sp.]|uniref:acyclic terpene utilization AtuA family protein n=1 Tax=uncultured Jannaschia sp. TaxID=293347 RepID=UPI002619657D|nr:acyclic terpene utilization AtuA family protein [uncultured Jannaschia sp.]